MYRHGWGVTKDHKEAYRWYRKAAKQGLAGAQLWLGIMYGKGQGVTRDYKEAYRWYRKAAKQGDAWAQYGLATLYANGHGVPQDFAEAVRWLRKAADQSHAIAQDRLVKLEKLLHAEGNWPPKPRNAKAPGSPSSDIEARLLKLKELENKELITEEEAARKRKQLLDKL
jgi:TPR repeat protein